MLINGTSFIVRKNLEYICVNVHTSNVLAFKKSEIWHLLKMIYVLEIRES